MFELEFDALPPPLLDATHRGDSGQTWRIDLDTISAMHPCYLVAQAFCIWFTGRNLNARQREVVSCLHSVLDNDRFTTLQVVLEPKEPDVVGICQGCAPALAHNLRQACAQQPTYLDKYYALHPGPPRGARRLVLLLPSALRAILPTDWLDTWREAATLVWRGEQADENEGPDFVWQERLAPDLDAVTVPGAIRSHAEPSW